MTRPVGAPLRVPDAPHPGGAVVSVRRAGGRDHCRDRRVPPHPGPQAGACCPGPGLHLLPGGPVHHHLRKSHQLIMKPSSISRSERSINQSVMLPDWSDRFTPTAAFYTVT